MINLKRFIKTAGAYLVGTVLSKLVSIFLLPLYTAHLDPAQYGTYDLVFTFINLVGPIAFLQVWDSMFRFSFDSEEARDKYALISNSFVACLFGMVVYFLIWQVINQFYHFDYYEYVVAYGLLFSIQYVYTFSARAFLDNTLFVLSGFSSTIVTALLNILLITVYHWDIKALYVSSIAGCLVQILLIECKLKLLGHFNIKDVSFDTIKRMIAFSAPLCVATISYWLLSGYSKIIINHFLGGYENGLYAVANKFASMITMLVSVFQFAWNEAAYMMANDENRRDVYGKVIGILLRLVFWGIAVAIIAIKIIFPYFIDAQYNAAINVVPAAIAGTAVNALAGFLGTLFSTEKKTSFTMVSTAIAAAVNVVGAIVGAKMFGLQGVVIALMVSFSVLLILRLWKLTKDGLFKIRFTFIKAMVMAGISTILFYVTSDMWMLIGECFGLLILFLCDVKSDLRLIIRKNG